MNKQQKTNILMKSYFSQRKESVILFFVILLASALMSMTLFFSTGNDIENELIRSIPMEVRLSNQNVFGYAVLEFNANYSSELILNEAYFEKEYPDYFNKYLSEIEERLSQLENVRFEYDIEVGFATEPDINQYGAILYSVYVYGVDSKDFFDDHFYTVTAGDIDKLWTEENAVAVDPSHLFWFNIDEPVTYKIGDTIVIDNTGIGEESIEFTVVAEYTGKYPLVTDIYEDAYDQGVIGANSMLLDNLNASTRYYFHHAENDDVASGIDRDNERAKVFNVTATASTLEGYYQAKEVLESIVKEMDQYSIEKRIKRPGFTIIESDFFKILSSVTRIKGTYQMIFIAVFMMLLFLFYSMLSYSLHKREKEIFIYHSLGERKGDIRIHYGLMYLIPSLLAGLLGILPGLLLSRLINTQILNSSKTLQAEFLRYSNNGALIENVKAPISLSFPSFSSVLLLSLLTLVIIALLVSLFSMIITSSILRKDRIKQLRG